MGFAHGWFRMVFRMSLRVIPIFWLEFLRVLEKKMQKGEPGKFGIYGPLRLNEGHPRHGKGHPRRGEVLRLSEGLPRHGEAEGLEKAPPPPPSGSPRCSPATPRQSASPQQSSASPWRSHCSHGPKFLFCF